MALFKLRKKADEARPAPAPAESVEVMRRRARHRLIGAVVLVLVGVVGFPVLFDTQPRPVDVDIPIEIPDRNQARPLAPLPQGRAPAPAPVVSGKVTPEPAPAAAPVAAPPATPVVGEAPAPAPAPSKPEPVAQKQPEPVAQKQPQERAEAKPAEVARAQALLEGKPAEGAGTRYVVQVGAFAEKEKARAAQQKLERAGLKNYTNVAETKNGPRIRVRAGPFPSRAEADRAVQKIKGLDLPAAILSL